MHKFAFAVLAATGVFVGSPASPQTANDVQSLHTRCDAELGSNDNFYCLGYVGGVLDHMLYTGSAPETLPKNTSPQALLAFRFLSACGQRITYGAAVQAFRVWAEKHPERWGDGQLNGVETAIRETWPCK